MAKLPVNRFPAAAFAAWYAITTLLLLSLAVLRDPLWAALTTEARLLFGVLVCAHLGSGAAILFLQYRDTLTFGKSLNVTTTIFGLAFLIVLGLQLSVSRLILAVWFGGGLIAGAVPLVMRRSFWVPVLTVVASVTVVAVGAAYLATLPSGPTKRETVVPTNLYGVRVSFYEKSIPQPLSRGGGIERFGDRVLLATGDGDLYLLRRRQGELEVRTVRGRVPINSEAFRSANEIIDAKHFHVADVLIQEVSESVIRLFVSHHFWKEDEKCFVLRVSMVEGDHDALWESPTLAWKTLFDTLPCLPITTKISFGGEQSGGRMALLDDHTILMTVGDQGYDGVAAQDYPQDMTASYGKTVMIHWASDSVSSRVYTLGHRNPQGLIVKSDGTIWSTEHGPRGGDELNHIVPGKNYGWPLVTYGTGYYSRIWPLNESTGRHDSFTPPVFAWIPSVAISSLREVRGKKFAKWEGDLLAGSLGAGTLFRVRVHGDVARFAEPIPVGDRIRDLALDSDGSIALWLDDGLIAFMDPVEEHAVEGEVLFWTKCGGCHTIYDGSGHGIGPDLRGIAARGVASAKDYDYSPALAGLSGNWTDDRFNAFLLDPEAVAPGTTMRNVSVKDPAERTAIVDYLKRLTD